MVTQTAGGSSAPPARTDIFLLVQTKRAGKIKGEGRTEGHTDDIEVSSWSWGVAAASAIGSTAATGRRQYKHLTIVKRVDSASTGLLSALATNDEVREAKLSMRKAGGEALDFYLMTLKGARVVGIDVDVDAAGQPIERVAFAYTSIDVEYKRQQAGGGNAGSFSFNDQILAA
jgi:type VI secretion system secreted protein Hcp